MLKKYSDLGLSSYNSDLDASNNINCKNPIILGLALNLSVLIMKLLEIKMKLVN